MENFAYASPASVKDAAGMLSNKWGEVEVLGGGTDLISLMKEYLVTPRLLVNVKNIKDLHGITGAKNEGLIFSRGKALKKVPQEELVDELFKEIDKYTATKEIEVDEVEQAAGAEWLQRIEEENAGELTPERLAKLEAEKQAAEADVMDEALLRLDESDSPTVSRRFTRA